MQKWYNYSIWMSSLKTTWRKNMNFKKIMAVVVAIFISLAASGMLVSNAEALDAKYEVSPLYKESNYYKNLADLTVGGDQAVDVVAVALSQLGYHEGNGDDDFHGMNAEGSKDFVEYNVFFGELDNNQGNGKSYGYSWCASFATWCLRHAGVSTEQSAQTDSKTYRSSWQWRRAFIEAGQYEENQEYSPQMGDIIFFKDVDDPTIQVSASHVGIVLFSDDNKVYTIEGNANSSFEPGTANDCVAVKSYPLDSKYIVGYGLPSYERSNADKLLGWQSASAGSEPKSLAELYENAVAGELIFPVWANDSTLFDVNIAEIVLAIVIIGGLVAAVAVIILTVFGKKKSNSLETDEKSDDSKEQDFISE